MPADDPDLTGLDDKILAQQGVENHPHGFILVRLARLLRKAIAAVRTLDARVTEIERRLPPE